MTSRERFEVCAKKTFHMEPSPFEDYDRWFQLAPDGKYRLSHIEDWYRIWQAALEPVTPFEEWIEKHPRRRPGDQKQVVPMIDSYTYDDMQAAYERKD